MTNAWRAYADSARSLPEDAGLRRLATVCLSANRVVRQMDTAEGGLPLGRPTDQLVRETGAHLVERASDASTRILGLTSRHWKRERLDNQDAEHWVDIAEARRVARLIEDWPLLAWVEMTAADQLVSSQRSAEGLVLAEAARRLVENPDFVGFGPYAAAEPRWRESISPTAATTVLRFNVWAVVRIARRYNGDLDGWREAVDKSVDAAREAFAHRSSLLDLALKARYDLQRALGEQADLSELETLRVHDHFFEKSFLQQSANNAAARGDCSRAVELQQQSAEMVLSRKAPEVYWKTVDELADILMVLPTAERRVLNDVANSAVEVAVNLVESGRADSYARDRTLALAWLRVADVLWAGWAHNGPRAVTAHRASLELGSNPDAVMDLIRVAQEAPRQALRVAVILSAARGATRHQALVLQQLESMLREPWEAHERATLLAARAWLEQRLLGVENARVEAGAREALNLLAGRSVRRLVPIAMAESVLATQASFAGKEDVERQAHLGAVSAIARMLLNATAYEQRLRIAREWAPSIRMALAFAEACSDAELADLVHEAVRRDGIGTLLAEVGNDALAPANAAKVAKDVGAAGRADTVQLLSGLLQQSAGTGTEESEGDERVQRSGAAVISANETAAYAQAQRVLGPLGSLIDPGTLYSARAATVVAGLPSIGMTFLLQLLPSTLVMVGEDEGPLLHRRLSWVDADGSHEVVDSVLLPEGLMDEPEPGDLKRWTDARPFFPGPLMAALGRASTDEPVRLLIVATGMFHIEFDGLKLGEVFLIQRAATTIHTSLTAIQFALSSARPWNQAMGSCVIFDSDNLPATAAELAALQRTFPVVREPLSKEMLRQSFEVLPPALLAMGVHGADDDRGWGQIKFLPGGETLSAAESLGFSFPELCVLASCHSRVREKGVDLAGFPTAMFARGATTVIGSIGKLYDVATSEILAGFYEELRVTANPVTALRAARLAWIENDPGPRLDSPELWARLVVYGGAHY